MAANWGSPAGAAAVLERALGQEALAGRALAGTARAASAASALPERSAVVRAERVEQCSMTSSSGRRSGLRAAFSHGPGAWLGARQERSTAGAGRWLPARPG